MNWKKIVWRRTGFRVYAITDQPLQNAEIISKVFPDIGDFGLWKDILKALLLINCKDNGDTEPLCQDGFCIDHSEKFVRRSGLVVTNILDLVIDMYYIINSILGYVLRPVVLLVLCISLVGCSIIEKGLEKGIYFYSLASLIQLACICVGLGLATAFPDDPEMRILLYLYIPLIVAVVIRCIINRLCPLHKRNVISDFF